MEITSPQGLKFKVGAWVIVTKRICEGPDVQMKGKIVEATRDFAIAECWTQEGPKRFTLSDDTASIVSFRRATQNDFRRQRR